MNKLKGIVHMNCKPPVDSPIGYLYPLYYKGKNGFIQLGDQFVCDICHHVVKMVQTEEVAILP